MARRMVLSIEKHHQDGKDDGGNQENIGGCFYKFAHLRSGFSVELEFLYQPGIAVHQVGRQGIQAVLLHVIGFHIKIHAFPAAGSSRNFSRWYHYRHSIWQWPLFLGHIIPRFCIRKRSCIDLFRLSMFSWGMRGSARHAPGCFQNHRFYAGSGRTIPTIPNRNNTSDTPMMAYRHRWVCLFTLAFSELSHNFIHLGLVDPVFQRRKIKVFSCFAVFC